MKHFINCKLTSAVSVNKERKPPNISNSNCIPNARQNKLCFISPAGAFCRQLDKCTTDSQ